MTENKDYTDRQGFTALINAAYLAYVTQVVMEYAQDDENAQELDSRLKDLADCINTYINNHHVRRNVLEPLAAYSLLHDRTNDVQVMEDFIKFFDLAYPDLPDNVFPTVNQMVYHDEQDDAY